LTFGFGVGVTVGAGVSVGAGVAVGDGSDVAVGMGVKVGRGVNVAVGNAVGWGVGVGLFGLHPVNIKSVIPITTSPQRERKFRTRFTVFIASCSVISVQ